MKKIIIICWVMVVVGAHLIQTPNLQSWLPLGLIIGASITQAGLPVWLLYAISNLDTDSSGIHRVLALLYLGCVVIISLQIPILGGCELLSLGICLLGFLLLTPLAPARDYKYRFVRSNNLDLRGK